MYRTWEMYSTIRIVLYGKDDSRKKFRKDVERERRKTNVTQGKNKAPTEKMYLSAE